MRVNIYGIHPDEIEAALCPSFPAYRIKQLLDWLYKKFANPLTEATNLPKDFLEFLGENYSCTMPETIHVSASHDGSRKFRLRLEDNRMIESVLIPEKHKNTLCLSTQVGCARACTFCATGAGGLFRNLTIHEIVSQIILASKVCIPHRITNLVFMGMGEPLDNLDSVLQVLRIIQHEKTLAFSPRHTTISTCGIIPGIIKLADSGIKVKLAVSLNSAIDTKRTRLMPINKICNLLALKQALLYYARKCTFRITFEYILIPGENMDREDLIALRKFVGDLPCKINFIPINPAPDSKLKSPTEAEITAFMKQAQTLPQSITLRRSRGADVFGACGQLKE